MPQMTASTARRSMARRAKSSGERFCACAEAIAHISASAESIDFFMVFSPGLRWRARNAVSGVALSPVSVLPGARVLELCQHLIEREAAGLLPRRELLIRGQVLAYEGLRRDEQ